MVGSFLGHPDSSGLGPHLVALGRLVVVKEGLDAGEGHAESVERP
jgi:hypothetical protein